MENISEYGWLALGLGTLRPIVAGMHHCHDTDKPLGTTVMTTDNSDHGFDLPDFSVQHTSRLFTEMHVSKKKGWSYPITASSIQTHTRHALHLFPLAC